MSLDRLRRSALRALGVVLVLASAWFALRGVSWGELVTALASTNVAFVACTTLPLLCVGSILRAGRYRALLPITEGRPAFVDVWSAVVVSAAANNVLPLRAGEVVRTRETMAAGVALAPVVLAQVAEKIVEAATLVLWAAPAITMEAGLARPLASVVPLLVVGAAGFVWASRRFAKIGPSQLASSAAWSLVADAVEIAVIAACLRGLGLRGDLATSVTVYAGVNLAIAIPSTPGNVGALEAGAALPLIALGAPHDMAAAFALIYRATQWLPATIAGALVLASRARLRTQ
jgi:uncharacterized membrane protein YbhN (UPF0104 family)